MTLRDKQLILYAPNVHTGGGFTLLHTLVRAVDKSGDAIFFLDSRARSKLKISPEKQVHWVQPTLSARLYADFKLPALTGENTIVLCFNGLPPISSPKGKIAVYHQNRNLFPRESLDGFAFKAGIRLRMERLISRFFRKKVDFYYVQTPSMRAELVSWLVALGDGDELPEIRLFPFFDRNENNQRDASCAVADNDFIYVSDGAVHKNHAALVAAWIVLAEQGLFPKLVLTLGSRDELLIRHVAHEAVRYGLLIQNVGTVSRVAVMNLYRNSKALIFPSLKESLGLPLVEASECGLAIIAPELDYVRDVCRPAQTFDPNSPQSIAKAVKRFLGHSDDLISIRSATEFVDDVMN